MFGDLLNAIPAITNIASAATSGKGLSSGLKTVGRSTVIHKNAKKFESMFMGTADLYASGFKSLNYASLYKFGFVGSFAGVAWLILKYLVLSPPEGKSEIEGNVVTTAGATTGAFITGFFVLMFIDFQRRQRTLSLFTGTNMLRTYLWFGVPPLVIGTIAMKLFSSADLKISILVSTFLSFAILMAAKKLYFVYRENELEAQVFTGIKEMFDACPGPGKQGCSHKHAGFKEPFENFVRPYLNLLSRFLPEPLTGSEIAADLVNRQSLQTMQQFVK